MQPSAGEPAASHSSDARNEIILDSGPELPDLAPAIHRQRLVIEGTRAEPISEHDIREYLSQLCVVCDMVPLIDPVTHHSERYGWAGWIHWETSGAHFYAWDAPTVFFSVDVYACRAFDSVATVEFTRKFFGAEQLVAKAL
jgi:S-adenosylmethionine decarboxylase